VRYVISDIHGEYDLLLRLLEKIRFSDTDTLYVLGDMIDKGEGSVGVLHTLLPMKNAKIILGNHEKAFLDYYRSLLSSGMKPEKLLSELRSYFPKDGGLLTFEDMDSLEELPLYIDAPDFIGVHAGVPLVGNGKIPPLHTVNPAVLLHDRRFKEPKVLPENERCVFFGHTTTESALGMQGIVVYRRVGTRGDRIEDYIKIHLDTGAFHSGTLGLFCIDTCYAYYVNKR